METRKSQARNHWHCQEHEEKGILERRGEGSREGMLCFFLFGFSFCDHKKCFKKISASHDVDPTGATSCNHLTEKEEKDCGWCWGDGALLLVWNTFVFEFVVRSE